MPVLSAKRCLHGADRLAWRDPKCQCVWMGGICWVYTVWTWRFWGAWVGWMAGWMGAGHVEFRWVLWLGPWREGGGGGAIR